MNKTSKILANKGSDLISLCVLIIWHDACPKNTYKYSLKTLSQTSNLCAIKYLHQYTCQNIGLLRKQMKRMLCRTGKMAQLVKSLAWEAWEPKYRSPALKSKKKLKKVGHGCICNPSAGGMEIGRPWESVWMKHQVPGSLRNPVPKDKVESKS